MQVILVLAATVAVAAAQGYQAYGPPPPQQNGNQQQELQQHQPQIFRHVYVHVAPDEPEDQQARTIRIPGGDKHVNIIFVKTPSQSSSAQTEVILPPQDEQKNLVYVLLKKQEATSDIKIRRPQAQRPTKPEVYFIRYKGQEEQKNGGYQQAPPSNNPGPSYGAPAPAIRQQPQSNYGAPF